MKKKIIKLSDIVIDQETQQRESIDLAMVSEYAESMQCGAKFPPVTVFFDGAQYWLADGYHRYHAHKESEIPDIQADIHDGTKDDAIMFSFGANGTHGKRLTNADKHKNVKKALSFHKTKNLSDRDIAKICHVTQPFVSKLRKEVITVITHKDDMVNKKVVTVTTPNDEIESNQEDEVNSEEQKILELTDAVISLEEENIRLKDALAVNQLPEDEIPEATVTIDDLRKQVKALEAELSAVKSTRDGLYVKVNELEKQCSWYLTKLKKAGLLK